MSNKKEAALKGASKKERKALEARAAEIAAELERRERKAAKKSAGKGKGKKSKPEPKKIDRSKVKKAHAADVGPIGVDPSISITAEPEAPIAIIPEPEDRSEILAAETAAAVANAATQNALIDEQIKARLKEKREARAGRLAEAQASVAENRAERIAAATPEAETPVEAVEAAEVADAVEIVATEEGREFVAGPSVAADEPVTFAKPSEAPKDDFESNGLGQYLVERPSDKKLVGYTRVTSYIKGIEDTSGLEKWKQRLLLEGVALAEETGDTATARIRELAHVRDVSIAKARKADRKGKLAAGELATYVDGANSEFRKALDKLADELFELGGGREKANKGTDLHAIFELHDREGMQAVADLLTLGQITPADMRDVEARAELVESWGIRFVDIERVVVNDAVPAPTPSKPGRVIGVAGRLDRTGYIKLPGETRARKRVIDDKTGTTLDFSKASISRQLAAYAQSVGYDLDTHKREDLKLDKNTAVVIHTPAGSGVSTLYSVDLVAGRKGLKIIADIRANRNEGKLALKAVAHEVTVD